jgi:hypothetical protein
VSKRELVRTNIGAYRKHLEEADQVASREESLWWLARGRKLGDGDHLIGLEIAGAGFCDDCEAPKVDVDWKAPELTHLQRYRLGVFVLCRHHMNVRRRIRP